MDHISGANYYRKKLPDIFKGEMKNDQTEIMKEKLSILEQVPLPVHMRKAQEHEKIIEA